MAISVFDIFRVGIGPSSSHTVGPMRAARRFARRVLEVADPSEITRITVDLYGSLGHTGRGHGTDRAVLLGLEGEEPELVDPAAVFARSAEIRREGTLSLLGRAPVPFDLSLDMRFHREEELMIHPNGMHFAAYGTGREIRHERTYYSVGGGFVVAEQTANEDRLVTDETAVPFPFDTCAKLLAHCNETGLAIHDIMMANESRWRSEAQVRAKLLRIRSAMKDCIDRGCRTEGRLPGGLAVERRAAKMYVELTARSGPGRYDPLSVLDWVNLFALAVNEENAAGGRVVTAPTNGAAGIIPAVLQYYEHFCDHPTEDGTIRLLLTAGAIAILYKVNASISGAEVGCQGEVGVACSMAAGGLAAALEGTKPQVENAAEIGMEHNLGLTCDPVGGLVQIPCIERNAMGAVKAINAMRLAMHGDGSHKVTLDKVIKTMRETGADMKTKYKETSRGGLALNVIEC